MTYNIWGIGTAARKAGYLGRPSPIALTERTARGAIMPILPISKKYPLPFNSFLTRAIMFFPDNELRRKEYAMASIRTAMRDDADVNSLQNDASPEPRPAEIDVDDFEFESDMMKA